MRKPSAADWMIAAYSGILAFWVVVFASLVWHYHIAGATGNQAAALERDIRGPFVVVEATSGAIGCGTMIELRGHVYCLTAKHVLDVDGKATLIKLAPWKHDYEQLGGAVVYRDPNRDLCLIDPQVRPAWDTATVADDDSELGETLWYIGAPNGVYASLEKTIANGRTADSPRYGRINGNGTFGCSGGGVFLFRKDCFVLIGVVSKFCADHCGPIAYEKGIPSFLAEYDP